uniref:Uncharacterized protein n=1 Tax=Davidia involucrata TaxID=16924 RepID=A0A5B7C9V3_DAVIN
MVVALGPGKFYGSSLPRPRIYTDVQLNDQRVDPPVPVLDPLMSWAEEAHWSMGGLSFKRHRLQGRIEGSINKLRAERENFLKKQNQSAAATDQIANSTNGSAPPPAPIATKRRRFMALIDDDDDDVEVEQQLERGDKDNNSADEEGVRRKRRGSPVNNLSGGSNAVALRTRSRGPAKENGDATDVVNKSNSKDKNSKANGKAKSKRVGENGASTPSNWTRISPRLAARGSS